MHLGKGFEVGGRVRIMHPAPGHDHRAFGSTDHFDRAVQFVRIGMDAAAVPHARLKEAFGVVIRLGLHVLTEGKRDGATFCWIGHRAEGARQRGEDVFGPGDAVEIAADRSEAVVCADRAIAEHFGLLQHRIGAAIGEDISGQEQHRQAVHMR